jgi:hypothetical protein
MLGLGLISGDKRMASTDPNKATGKSGQRKKADQRSPNQKRNRQQSLKADEREKPAELQIAEPDHKLSSDPEQRAEPDHEVMQESDLQQNHNSGELLVAEPDEQGSVKSGEQNEPPGQKPDQQLKSEPEQQSPRADQRQDTKERIGAPLDPAEIVSATGATAATENVRVNFQTIANAYGDYTRKSLEQTRSFVEKLTGVRSLDKAMEAQAEFAKQSYETFIAGSQRICELHRALATQAFRPLRRLSSDKRPEQR